ncbi:hypothetical protein, partial [Salmonella sp. s54925]
DVEEVVVKVVVVVVMVVVSVVDLAEGGEVVEAVGEDVAVEEAEGNLMIKNGFLLRNWDV